MTTHELYLNDVLLDIDKDVNIYPKYQSPIFTDISRIVSNVSNNISLPLTPNNARAINMYHFADKSDAMDAYNAFPRRWHTVKYFRNGIQICEEGRGMISGIEDGRINFAFTWGNVDNFKKLEDKNLNEMAFLDNAVWGKSTEYVSDPNVDFGFYDIDFGVGGGYGKLQYQHPCVNTNFIIKKIAQENGIVINNKRNDKYITDHFLIPCLTKLGYKNEGDIPNNKFQSSTTVTSDMGAICPDKIVTDSLKVWDSTTREFKFRGLSRVKFTMSGFFVKYTYKKYWDIYDDKQNPILTLRIGTHSFKPIYKNHSPRFKYFELEYAPVDINLDTHEDEIITVRLYPSTIEDELEFTSEPPKITIVGYTGDCVYRPNADSYFPLAVNLPEMKQIDFLKAIFQMNGLFAYSNTPNTIDLLSVDDIIAKIPSAYDWTDKLVIESNDPSVPAKMEFKFSDFAQKNVFSYDNEDDTTFGSWYVTVNNKTLSSKPRDMVELPFSHTEKHITDGVELARIPIYTPNDESEPDFDLTPRILRLKPNSNKATFDELDWKSILKKKYTGYQNVIRNPRVLKVECKLSDLELSMLDFSKPVTFNQFGNYYAILKIESAADNICDCEFLELKVG